MPGLLGLTIWQFGKTGIGLYSMYSVQLSICASWSGGRVDPLYPSIAECLGGGLFDAQKALSIQNI